MTSKHSSSEAQLSLRPIAYCLLLAFCEAASANPTGAKVTAGAASMQEVGKTLTVTNAPGTIINWQGFSIGSGEHTKFVQQSAASAVLNRVVGSDVSSILGALSSNGRVFLVNPNGIVFGAGSRIDTAGFIASTLNIADKDFLAGKLKFEGGGNGVLRNEGAIRASGDIMLVGPSIQNAGSIVSDHGSVLLAAGQKVTITSPDAQGVRFELQAPSDTALNVGTIDAASSAAMFAGTLRHSGDIRARGATLAEGGKVSLVAQKEAIVDRGATITASGVNGGSVTIQSGDLTLVSGHVDATGSAGKGGTVQILGNLVGLTDGASIDASGDTGGGTILVGGDYQGKNADVQNAWRTYVSADSTLKADAITSGDGGKVIVWADDINRYYGSISARGGSGSGDGGFVEVSGKRYLDFNGQVDTRAPHGAFGTLLLDPTTIDVVNADTGNPDTDKAGGEFRNTGGVAPDRSQILMSTLVNTLKMNDVVIDTSSTGGGDGDINFNQDFNYDTIARTAGLTLIANRNINLNGNWGDAFPGIDRINLSTSALNAVNVGGVINLRGGNFNATGGSGVVNMSAGTPTLNEVNQFSANVLNIGNSVTAALNTTSGTTLGVLNMNSGTLTTGATLTIEGALNWSGGTIAGSGSMTTSGISSNTISGPAVLREKQWTNSGVLTFTSNGVTQGSLQLGNALDPNPASFINSGTVGIGSGSAQDVITSGAPGAFFTNAGALNKGAGSENRIVTTFNNGPSGAVTVSAGTLVLDGSGSDAGEYVIQDGATLRLASGTRDFTGVSLSGSGTLRVGVNGTLNVTTAYTQNAADPRWSIGGEVIAGNALIFNRGVDWTNGTITGNGLLTTGVGSTSSITGDVTLLNKQWNQLGTLDFQAGRLALAGAGPIAARIVNNGTINFNVGGGLDRVFVLGPVPGKEFLNAGTVNAAAPDTVVISAPFSNVDTVNVNSGTLELSGPGTDSGAYSIAQGAELIVGTRTFNAGVSVTGAGLAGSGTFTVDTGGTLTLNSSYTQLQDDPTWHVAGEVRNTQALTFNGEVIVEQGLFSGGGLLTTGANSDVTITRGPFGGLTSFGGRIQNKQWDNLGTVHIVDAGGLSIEAAGEAAQLTNKGVISFEAPGSVIAAATSGQPVGVRNEGLVTKSSGGISTISAPFTNVGTGANGVTVTAGTLQLDSSGADTGRYSIGSAGRLEVSGGIRSMLNAPTGLGTLKVSNTAALDVQNGPIANLEMTGGTLSRSTAGAITISGSLAMSGGTIAAGADPADNNFVTLGTSRFTSSSVPISIQRPWVNSGDANIASGATVVGTQDVTNQAGAVLSGGGTLAITGHTLTNDGTVRPEGINPGLAGTLSIIGNYVQTGGGALEIDIGGVGPGTADLLAVNGNATLDGALRVNHVGDFAPMPDTAFNVVSYTTHTGDFATKTFPTGYDVLYSSTAGAGNYTLSLGDIINRWSGPVAGGSWAESANWSLVHAPKIFEDAFIRDLGAAGPTATITIEPNTQATARKLTSFENVTVGGGSFQLGVPGFTQSSQVNAELLVSAGKLQLDGPINANSIRVSGATAILDAGFGTLPRLTLEQGVLQRTNGGDITINGPFNVSGGAILSSSGAGDLVTAGVTTVTGIVNPLRNWRNTGTIDLNSGEISPSPGSNFVFTNALGATLNIRTPDANPFSTTEDAAIVNAGTINKLAAPNQRFAGTFTNTGLLDVFAGTLAVPFMPLQSGTVTIRAGATLSTENHDLTNDVGGKITGGGRLDLSTKTLTNLGALQPGLRGETGTLTIAGNLVQTPTGHVDIDLGPNETSDILAVTGSATLGGALNVSTVGGYTATDGDAFTVFTGTRTGTFATIVPTNFVKPIVSAYGARSLSLSVNSAPLNFWESDASGSWTDATRWSLGHAPLVTEQVRIMRPEAITVTVPAGPSFAERLRSDENMVVEGSLTLLNRSVINAALTLNGGSLLGTAPVTVNGLLTLNGATLANTGGVTVNGITGTLTGATQVFNRLATGGFSMNGGSVTIAPTGELDLTGSLESDISSGTIINNGLVNISGTGAVTLRNGALWDNFGTTNLSGSSRFVIGGGSAATRLVNRGTGAINDSSSAGTLIGATGANGSFVNAGAFTKASGSAATQFVDAAMTNTGSIAINNGTLIATSFPVNSGTIAVSGGATFSTSDAALTNSAAGLLMGNGTFNVGGGTLTNAGTIRPGSSPGALTIDGNFTQTSTGTLEIEVGGTRAGVDYDLLKVTGNANLGGTLAIQVPAGTQIAANSDFDFMTYASHTGDFATKTFPAGVSFVGAPGPSSYGISPPAPINSVPETIQTVTTRDALVFSDQLSNPTTQQVNVLSTNESADIERKRDAVPECR